MGSLPYFSVTLEGMELVTGEKWREIRVFPRLGSHRWSRCIQAVSGVPPLGLVEFHS